DEHRLAVGADGAADRPERELGAGDGDDLLAQRRRLAFHDLWRRRRRRRLGLSARAAREQQRAGDDQQRGTSHAPSTPAPAPAGDGAPTTSRSAGTGRMMHPIRRNRSSGAAAGSGRTGQRVWLSGAGVASTGSGITDGATSTADSTMTGVTSMGAC